MSIEPCVVTCYTIRMIKSFKHKGLENFFLKGSKKGISPSHEARLRRILFKLDTARTLEDLNIPGFRLHQYSNSKTLSIDVSGNYRILFEFENGHVFIVDYLDPH